MGLTSGSPHTLAMRPWSVVPSRPLCLHLCTGDGDDLLTQKVCPAQPVRCKCYLVSLAACLLPEVSLQFEVHF